MKSISVFLTCLLLSAQVFTQTPNCNTINVTTGFQSISASGVAAAPIVGIQVFNSSWAGVFSQTYTTHGDVITASPILPGQYHVNIRFYNSNWSIICEKAFDVTVDATVPPPGDSCTLTFQKTFGTIGADEYPIDLVKTVDGGYAGAGMANASGNLKHDALLMKFDSRGNLLWSKTYGDTQVDYFFTVSATSDGGLVAGGSINSSGYGAYDGDAWLVKTDVNGNIQWQKKYTDNSNAGSIRSVIQTSDGGFAFVGDQPYTPGLADWLVVKTDANGNIQWKKKFGTGNSDDGIGIVEDNHGGAGLVVSGYNYSSTSYDADLVKFDLTTGNVFWTKTYDLDNRANRFTRIFKVNDGFVINAVTHDGFANANSVSVLVKTDFDGNIVLAKEVRVPGARDGHITPLNDGGYLYYLVDINQDQNTDIHSVRLDASGNPIWAKKYIRAGLQSINKLVTDGNYVVGIGNDNSGVLNDVLLVKAHISGRQSNCTSVDETATVRTPVITTLTSPFTTNTTSTVLAVNTTATPVVMNYNTTVFCIDSCGMPPPPPQIVSISNVTVNENAGNAVLQACLSGPATDTMWYVYNTLNGTATSGSDFTGGTGLVRFNPGQTCASISIPIINDAIGENRETFIVAIGAINTVSGTVTINDDDNANCAILINITPAPNQIKISGIDAPITTVQIFNSSWATVFNQTYTNEPGNVTIPIAPGTYLVKVTYYYDNWQFICDKSQNVTVPDACPAGTICKSNVCPSQTVDLTTAYSVSNLPPGTTVSWHTGTPATDANKMTPAQAQNVSVSGTYYAAINISGANCYSQTIPVNVTIINCTSAGMTNAVQLKTEGTAPTKSIMAFPNPFTRSVRVVIDSEKKERASIILTDVLGRQLKSLPVQLVPGSNTFSMEGLDQFPSGNYFLTIQSSGERKTIKLMRQQ